MINANHFWTRQFLIVCFLCLGGANINAAPAPDLNLELKLIWGTNDPTSPNPKHKKLDTGLTKWLSKTYKWKNYFEENQQVVSVPLSTTRKAIPMSKECTLDIKNLGNSRIEVTLFGNGKQVNTVTQALPKDDRLVFAGDAQNNTAWFVAIKVVPAPAATSKDKPKTAATNPAPPAPSAPKPNPGKPPAK